MKADPLGPDRPRLLGLAYRMLGSRAEAEDVLQDAWLRFDSVRDVGDQRGLLTTIVTRLCLDRLKSAQFQRQTYIGPWLPEPIADAEAWSPHKAVELADDLSFALLLALERLKPAERAAFLLHDVFDLQFPQIAGVLERSEAACRQLATRARKAVRVARPVERTSTQAHARLLSAFGMAVKSGDLAGLVALLREDAVLLSDGGGKKLAALNPINGADRISRFFLGTVRKQKPSQDFRIEMASINGAPALLAYVDDALDLMLSIEVDGERIVGVFMLRNPDKLAALQCGSGSPTEGRTERESVLPKGQSTCSRRKSDSLDPQRQTGLASWYQIS